MFRNIKKNNTKKGFTLIELLVVISIIGLLSSIVLSALNDARMKARDSQRISDLQQIRLALELYADENDGNYPADTDVNWFDGTNSTDIAGTDAWQTGFLGTALSSYLSTMPIDPINDGGNPSGGSYSYGYMIHRNNTKVYDLFANYETGNTPSCATTDWKADALSEVVANTYWCSSLFGGTAVSTFFEF